MIRRFIHPFGLGNTSPSDRRELAGLATGYLSPDNDFGLPARTTLTPGLMAWHPGIEWSGGGFISNSQDLAKWFVELFSPSRIKNPPSTAIIAHPKTIISQWRSLHLLLSYTF